tara:strand:- start:95 stop:469 length:375 start_codon:yes stop_codon:yes gene_type:complete
MSKPYEVIKFATRELKKELNKSLKPAGFDVSIKTRVGGYWNDGTILIDISAPSWFIYNNKDDRWMPSEKATNLAESLKKRILNILTTENLNEEVWGDELTKDDIRDKIVWETNFRGSEGTVRIQ